MDKKYMNKEEMIKFMKKNLKKTVKLLGEEIIVGHHTDGERYVLLDSLGRIVCIVDLENSTEEGIWEEFEIPDMWLM